MASDSSSQNGTAPDQSSKPRLLFVVTEYSYFASHKLDLAQAAADAGYDVTVAARCDPAQMPTSPEFQVIPLNWTRTGSIFSALLHLLPELLRVRALVRRIKPDVLHNISLKPAIIGSLAALGSGSQVVNSINGFGYLFFARSLLAKGVQYGCGVVLRLAQRRNRAVTVLQNQEDADYARTTLGFPETQVRVIRGSGIDLQAFSPTPEPAGPTIRFLILARLLHMKGIGVAVAAHELLCQRGVDCELVVCGAADPGNPSSISQSQIEAWAALPGVVFKGQVPDVRPELAASHVVLIPSLGGEGLPRALLEAAAMERPMIASDIGGNREIVVPEETGMLVPANDAEALADAMARVIQHPMLRMRWGTAARHKIAAEFTQDVVRAQHVALYEGLARLAEAAREP